MKDLEDNASNFSYTGKRSNKIIYQRGLNKRSEGQQGGGLSQKSYSQGFINRLGQENSEVRSILSRKNIQRFNEQLSEQKVKSVYGGTIS